MVCLLSWRLSLCFKMGQNFSSAGQISFQYMPRVKCIFRLSTCSQLPMPNQTIIYIFSLFNRNWMNYNGKYEKTIFCIHHVFRVTIPTKENGDVSTFLVQDGFVFDSGAGIKFEFSTICVVSFSLFAWSVFHYLRGQFFTICLVSFSLFAWSVFHYLLGQFFTICVVSF